MTAQPQQSHSDDTNETEFIDDVASETNKNFAKNLDKWINNMENGGVSKEEAERLEQILVAEEEKEALLQQEKENKAKSKKRKANKQYDDVVYPFHRLPFKTKVKQFFESLDTKHAPVILSDMDNIKSSSKIENALTKYHDETLFLKKENKEVLKFYKAWMRDKYVRSRSAIELRKTGWQVLVFGLAAGVLFR